MAGKTNPDRLTRETTQAVIQRAKDRKLKALIRSLSNVIVEDGITRLGFAYKFHYEEIQKHQQELESIVGPVTFDHLALAEWALQNNAHITWVFDVEKEA